MAYVEEIKQLDGACKRVSDGILPRDKTVTALIIAAASDVQLCNAILEVLETKDLVTLHTDFCIRVAELCSKNRNVHGLSREFGLYKAAIEKNPNSIKATLEFGNVFLADGKYVHANEFFEKAVVLSKAANNMVLQEQAYFGWSKGLAALSEIDKAIETMEAGAKAEGVPPYRSSFWAPAYLMVLNYSDTRSRDDVSRTHLEWGKWQREVIGPYERPATRNRDRNRKLRIGQAT